MTLTGWTGLVFALFLALPLSRQVAGQPVSGGGTDVIVLFGHSHIENWKVQSLAGFQAINRGRGGDHTQDLLDRFDRDVLSDHPRAVVIWAFDNDVMDVPNRDKAVATKHAKANLIKLIETAKAHGIEPIVTTEVTILPAGFSQQVADTLLWLMGKSSYEERVNGRIVEWNAWLRGHVQRRHLLLFDFQRALADLSDRRRPQYAVPDGIHLTKEAYDVITAQADATLRANLRR
jgi:lysophospholipase L1-like esterase